MLSHKHLSVNIYLVPDKVSPLNGWGMVLLKKTGFKNIFNDIFKGCVLNLSWFNTVLIQSLYRAEFVLDLYSAWHRKVLRDLRHCSESK